MQHLTRLSIEAQATIQAQTGGGGITTSGITDFINTQVIPVLLIAAAVAVLYFFLTGKQKMALTVIAGSLVGIGFVGLIGNWQALSTWVAGLVGQ